MIFHIWVQIDMSTSGGRELWNFGCFGNRTCSKWTVGGSDGEKRLDHMRFVNEIHLSGVLVSCTGSGLDIYINQK